jgi:hypothetical protein
MEPRETKLIQKSLLKKRKGESLLIFMVIWLRDCVQRSTAMQVGGGNSSPVYGIDTKRVGRFTLEERRQLLQRFQQKRAQRNFNKKIKVDLLHLCSCNVKLQCVT